MEGICPCTLIKQANSNVAGVGTTLMKRFKPFSWDTLPLTFVEKERINGSHWLHSIDSLCSFRFIYLAYSTGHALAFHSKPLPSLSKPKQGITARAQCDSFCALQRCISIYIISISVKTCFANIRQRLCAAVFSCRHEARFLSCC
jgi:hypothetical protein